MRCVVICAAYADAESLAELPAECVEDAPGERLRERSVHAGETHRPRSGVAGVVEDPGDFPYWCASFPPLPRARPPRPGSFHRGGHAVAAFAPDLVHVTRSVPSASCPSASGEESAVDAAKTRLATRSTRTKLKRCPALNSRSWALRASARALGSAFASRAAVKASPTRATARVGLTRRITASGRRSTCGACGGPASGSGAPSPRNVTAPTSFSRTV